MEFIFGVLILVLDIWAIINVWQSSSSTTAKLLWTLGIVLFPVLGVIVWFFAGPRGRMAIA